MKFKTTFTALNLILINLLIRLDFENNQNIMSNYYINCISNDFHVVYSNTLSEKQMNNYYIIDFLILL